MPDRTVMKGLFRLDKSASLLGPTAALLLLFGTVVSCATAGEVERMSWLDNGQIRLGADLTIGGAITFLADSDRKTNVINSHDWGRQVQMSFYSGPTPFEPDGKKPRPSWAGLGWNPIQSGDCYGHQSQVVDHRNDGREIYVKCIPMHWPLNDQPGQCTFECWYRLEGRTVQVRSRLNNARSDTTQYAARSQELPAVYTNGPYHKLMTYTGAEPFADGPLTEIPKQNHPPGGIRWRHWKATENWAALVNDDDWGLGVWHPGVYSFIGGFAGKPGSGGPKDGPTGYIAPLHREILDHNIAYDYRYVLILDSLANIRRHVREHADAPAPPRYVFESDRQHWTYHQAHDSGWPIEKGLHLVADGSDIQLLGPPALWQAHPDHRLRLVMAINTDIRPGLPAARVYWRTAESDNFTSERSVPLELIADGQPHTYTVDLGSAPGYQGAITGLRLDPIENSKEGDQIDLYSLIIE
jgi:hypothetical protein